MKCTIFLHSTTGNTKLVTRHARSYLQQLGHDVTIHDVVKRPDPPPLVDADLIAVASPTMYFRPTIAIERFVACLPPLPAGKKPAFLLGTSHGMPSAHFAMLAEQLAHKNIVTLGAQNTTFPTNWPLHRAAVSRFPPSSRLGELLAQHWPRSRGVVSCVWTNTGWPAPNSPERLQRFLDAMVEEAERAYTTDFAWAPSTRRFNKNGIGAIAAGRLLDQTAMRKGTSITIYRSKCSRCGTCVNVCPVGCLTRDDDEAPPRVGDNCTGCWACFNRCPDGAIGGFMTPPGVGQYKGPSKAVREMFKLR